MTQESAPPLGESANLPASSGSDSSVLPADPPQASPPWSEFREMLGDLKTRLGRLETAILDQAQYETGRQSLIDQLHAELQEAKTDLVWKILRPVLLDLVKLHDELSARAVRSQRLQPPPEASALLGELCQDVIDMLARQGVTSYRVDGERFDPRRQQVARTAEAPSASEVGKVVERLEPGFACDERVLRPEKVIVLAARANP